MNLERIFDETLAVVRDSKNAFLLSKISNYALIFFTTANRPEFSANLNLEKKLIKSQN